MRTRTGMGEKIEGNNTRTSPKNSVRLIEIPKPLPKKGQVLLETLCVGIDGTDREIDEGLYGTPPRGSGYIVLGHEAMARVEEIGHKGGIFSEGI